MQVACFPVVEAAAVQQISLQADYICDIECTVHINIAHNGKLRFQNERILLLQVRLDVADERVGFPVNIAVGAVPLHSVGIVVNITVYAEQRAVLIFLRNRDMQLYFIIGSIQ